MRVDVIGRLAPDLISAGFELGFVTIRRLVSELSQIHKDNSAVGIAFGLRDDLEAMGELGHREDADA